MKKLLFVLLISSAVHSQNVTKKETINQLLCKTWIADYAMLDGLKVEKMGQMKSLEYTFKTNGTYLGNKTVSGTWKYNAKKKNIDLFVNGILKSTITTLQNKKITMVLSPEKSAPKMGKFEIYFKLK